MSLSDIRNEVLNFEFGFSLILVCVRCAWNLAFGGQCSKSSSIADVLCCYYIVITKIRSQRHWFYRLEKNIKE